MKRLIICPMMLILLSLINCGALGYRTLEKDSDALVPLLQGSSSKSISKQMGDSDLKWCPILIEQGIHDAKIKKIKRGEWDVDKSRGGGVDQIWLIPNTTWEIYSGIALDAYYPKYKSYTIQKDSSWKLVYIGPWKYVEKLGKQIRLISTQENDPKEKSGAISNYFESMDEENKKIPEMPLKLIKPAYGDEFCILKWHAKYGYSSIAETYAKLRPGFWAWVFRDYEIVVTGKIIEAKE